MSKSIEFSNGHKMPIIGLGTGMVKEFEELERSMNAAFDIGYRHFDTAAMYGNEHFIGDILQGWLASGKVTREELFITTKLPSAGMNESLVSHFLKKSLSFLKLDYVDLYLIHSPIGLKYFNDENLFPKGEDGKLALDMNTDLVKIWKGMEAEVDAGRTKSIGLSNFNESQIDRIFNCARIKPANLQIELNPYFQQKELREVCKKYGISVCAYAPFGSPGRKEFYEKLGVQGFVPTGLMEDPIVLSIAEDHGKAPGQILLKFLVQQDVIVIPKSSNVQRLAQNAAIFDFTLTTEDMEKLVALDRGEEGRTFNIAQHAEAKLHPEYPYTK